MNQNIASKEVEVSSDLNLAGRASTDLELVKRAQGRRSRSVCGLISCSQGEGLLHLRPYDNNTAQAEDLTQDAFLQVFRKLSTFKELGAIHVAISPSR